MKPGGSLLKVSLTVSSDQAAQYSVRAAYLAAGHPAGARALVTVTVNSGIKLKAGLITGTGWATGSSVRLVNNGYIYGTGGVGGAGAWTAFSAGGAAASGSAGGDAIQINVPITIDNGSGYIWGGGGGGGGGGSGSSTDPPGNSELQSGGGGGGGGVGFNNAAGGAKGDTVNTPVGDGYAGSAGSEYSAGSGSAGGYSDFIGIGHTYWIQGGTGGNGGGWGEPGITGGVAYADSLVSPLYSWAPGNGGAAGYAVRKNGYSCTFTAGNDATRVKGAVA